VQPEGSQDVPRFTGSIVRLEPPAKHCAPPFFDGTVVATHVRHDVAGNGVAAARVPEILATSFPEILAT